MILAVASVHATSRAPLSDVTRDGSAAMPQPSSSTVLSSHRHSAYAAGERDIVGEWDSRTTGGRQSRSASTCGPYSRNPKEKTLLVHVVH